MGYGRFDKLPLEVIQYIFTLCCGGVKIIVPQPRRGHAGTTQVTLSLVCARWREIVLSTGALWANVAMTYYGGRSELETETLQVLQDLLNRSGMSPISVSITVYAAHQSPITRISQALLPSFRIRDLDLRSAHCPMLVPTNNSDSLETLHLTLDWVDQKVVFPRLPEMPSLRELHLDLRIYTSLVLTNVDTIPWHQLRVLTVREKHWPSRVLLRALQRCKSLIDCTLFMIPEKGQPERDVLLFNLESFSLDLSWGSSADRIIRSLILPNVKSLDIGSCDQRTQMLLSQAAIRFMAQRSGLERLTHFSLTLTRQPMDVGGLLKCMPALNSVKIQGPLTFQETTFEDLSIGTIGPQLEKIYFGVIADEEIELMLKTIGKRYETARAMRQIKPFASVTIHCIRRSNFELHSQQAKQYSELFDTHVAIIRNWLKVAEVHLTDPNPGKGPDPDSDIESDSDSGVRLVSGKHTDEKSDMDDGADSEFGVESDSDGGL